MLSVFQICHLRSIQYNCYFMDFHYQLTVVNDSVNIQIQGSHSLRFISAQKWKTLMIKVLNKLGKKQHYDHNLIDDLTMVVEKIPEEKFIQTIMHIQPFKPNFMRRRKGSISKQKCEGSIQHQLNEKHHLYEYKRMQLSSIIKFKQEMHVKIKDSIFQIHEKNPKSSILQQIFAMIIEEQTLSRQFQTKCHPYRIIIDQFLFLLEHKFKNYITNNESQVYIEKVQQVLLYDLNLLQEFVIKTSVPYVQIFKSKNKEERMEFQIQLIAFIKKYLDKHSNINLLIKKIMKFALKQSMIFAKLLQSIPIFIQIDRFNIEQEFKIHGQYSFALNSLVQFSQSTNPTHSLTKLRELRSNIIKDIDEYYQRSNRCLKESIAETQSSNQLSPKRQLKISVENQLQILKFLLCKGKIFLFDILAELKHLQTVLGQEDLSYKYDESSFMYAQLMVAIQILAQEFH